MRLWWLATKNDKKMEAGVIKFILLDRLGHAYVGPTVTDEEMKDALDCCYGAPGRKIILPRDFR